MANLTTWRRTLQRDMNAILAELDSRAPLRQGLTRLLHKVAGATGLARRGGELFAPDVELLTEHDDAYVLRLDLHGFREKDVDVRVDGDMLVVSGERRNDATRRESHDPVERTQGAFTRAIAVPRGVDLSRIFAEFHQGILEVRLAKVESLQPREGLREEPRVRFSVGRRGGGHSLDTRS